MKALLVVSIASEKQSRSLCRYVPTLEFELALSFNRGDSSWSKDPILQLLVSSLCPVSGLDCADSRFWSRLHQANCCNSWSACSHNSVGSVLVSFGAIWTTGPAMRSDSFGKSLQKSSKWQLKG